MQPELVSEVCPIVDCTNNGGKGFKDLHSHFHRQHKMGLKNCQGQQRKILLKTIEKFNRVLFRKYHIIKAKSNKDKYVYVLLESPDNV